MTTSTPREDCTDPTCESCGAPLEPLTDRDIQEMQLDCLLRIQTLLEMLVGVESEALTDEDHAPAGQH